MSSPFWRSCACSLKDWGGADRYAERRGSLDFCTDNEVDLIISDVVMPVGTVKLLNRIHKGSLKYSLSCLPVTVFQYAQEALRSGALDYIVKRYER